MNLMLIDLCGIPFGMSYTAWSQSGVPMKPLYTLHACTSVIDLCEQRVYDLVTKQNSQYM